MLSGLAIPHAGASSLGDLQAQARQLETQISDLGNQEAQLSERYDAARLALKASQTKVLEAREAVASATGKADKAKGVLQADAVNAYVDSGSGSVSGSSNPSSISGADASLLRAEYEQSLATNQSDSEDQYRLASVQATTAETNLKKQEAAAAANVSTIAGDEKQVEATQSSLESAEAQDKGRIATLIAQQQAAQARAEQAAARQRLAAEQAAQLRATQSQERAAAPAVTTPPPTAPTPSTTGTTTTPNGGTTTTPNGGTTTAPTPVGTTPPVSTGGGGSSVAAAAVQAALSRVGDPYVWGAAGPDAFDCSGLVMWAYDQAGVSLPHFSGAQYADTTHISMADLEPGDLVFFSDPGEHVAMYIGNGDVVQAPYTGADVQVVPLYSEFTLASRVS
jgi:cell wall-associated NlpC family hydrolase